MKKTYVCILLDRSGSMNDIKEYAVRGYNEQVQQLRADAEEQKGENEYYISLITFNGKVYEHLWNVSAEELKEASHQDYVCVGNTALYDAQGYAIGKLLETTNPDDPEVAYLLILITDGENNKVMHYTIGGLKELCQSVQKKGNWTITYMGCDGKYLEEHAINTGVSLGNCAVWQNNAIGTEFAFEKSRHKLQKYTQQRKAGLRAANSFHGDSEVVMANYVPPGPQTYGEGLFGTALPLDPENSPPKVPIHATDPAQVAELEQWILKTLPLDPENPPPDCTLTGRSPCREWRFPGVQGTFSLGGTVDFENYDRAISNLKIDPSGQA